MPGKEYKARNKKVQKMSRDGLIEENLRTGETRRLLPEREGVRIGDRPMELTSDQQADAGSVRMGRHGIAGNRKNHGRNEARPGSISYFREPGDLAEEDNGQNKRMVQKRGAAHKGAPRSDSYEGSLEDAGADGTVDHRDPAGGYGPYEGEVREGNGSRRKRLQSRYDSFLPDRDTNNSEDNPLKEAPPYMDGYPENGGSLDGCGADENHRRRMRSQRAGAEFVKQTEPVPAQGGGSGEKAGPAQPAFQDGGAIPTQPAYSYGKTDYEEPEDPESRSMRLRQARDHPAGRAGQAARYAGRLSDDGNPHGKGGPDYNSDAARKSRLREDSSEFDGLDSMKEEIRAKRKKERLNHEQRKAGEASRLSFDDGRGMVRGSGTGFSRKAADAAAEAAVGAAGIMAGASVEVLHAKLSEAESEEENAGLQAAHGTELATEASARTLALRRKRAEKRGTGSRRLGANSAREGLHFEAQEEPVLQSAESTIGRRTAQGAKADAERKAAAKRFFAKQRQRRVYAAAKQEEKAVEQVVRSQQGFTAKAASVIREAVVRNSNVILIAGIAGIVFLMIAASLGSCAALMQGAGHSVISTTYPSTDEDIYAVENRYRELEAGLDAQVNQMRQEHPAYDEFRYQIDEISHNPYHLISYFTTKYGQFTYEQVKDELEEIFREQYSLTTTGEEGLTVTETRTIHAGESLGEVVTTGYCPCEICCGPYAGGPTASGVYPMSGYTIAVDTENPFVPLGTHVIMNGIEYVVEDTGGFGSYGVQFDVYYDDHESALAHGTQTWEATLAEGGGISELEVTTTRTINRMSVVLTNHDLDAVLQARLTDDKKVRYGLYNITYGNRDYLFDLNSLPRYGRAADGYTIPPEALSDEQFARMIAEAEKYLGVPYVWGGYSPSGFDCSGFVCWVINHCGNGWNIGRTTAEGIRQQCSYVPPELARPGDIIFFENTYETAGASHVGIYVGDNMMIHCGEPVQYTSTSGAYWSSHFMQFGRLY